MTVPVFELPGTTSNMYFVHVNLMNSVENTKIQKCVKDRLDLLYEFPRTFLFIIPQIGTFWSPEQNCLKHQCQISISEQTCLCFLTYICNYLFLFHTLFYYKNDD